MSIEQIIFKIVLPSLSTLVGIIGIIVAVHKLGIEKLLKLYERVPALVREANALFGKGNGVNKLTYVLTQLKLYAYELKVKVKQEVLIAKVEDEVATLNAERDASKQLALDPTPTETSEASTINQSPNASGTTIQTI